MSKLAPILAALVTMAIAPDAAPAAERFAPLNAQGPKLTVPKSDLRASLRCSKDVGASHRTPVLVLSGTAIDTPSMYGWNLERALAQEQVPYCASDQAGELRRNMDDLQVRGEYVTYGIRRLHALSGKRIAVIGHSQGGMIPRWSLRFWPGARAMVKEVIGVAADNHGTTTAGPVCAAGCSAASRQQAPDAQFMRALNSRAETFRGIDYTQIYSYTDTFVAPNGPDGGTSSLSGPGRITNVAIQDICPLDVAEHLLIGTVDPVAWALSRDALAHSGPANPKRIPANVCAQALMPGVDPATAAPELAAAAAYFASSFAYPQVPAEPPLRCYVTASCWDDRDGR